MRPRARKHSNRHDSPRKWTGVHCPCPPALFIAVHSTIQLNQEAEFSMDSETGGRESTGYKRVIKIICHYRPSSAQQGQAKLA